MPFGAISYQIILSKLGPGPPLAGWTKVDRQVGELLTDKLLTLIQNWAKFTMAPFCLDLTPFADNMHFYKTQHFLNYHSKHL